LVTEIEPVNYYRILVLTFVIAAEVGCVWHAESMDHFLGPALFRVATPPDSKAFLAQQAWFPLLIEGGSRWGITLGYFNKLLGIPMSNIRKESEESNTSDFFWRSFVSIAIGSWRMSLFYTSIEQHEKARFLASYVIGFQLSAGFDDQGSNLTIGTAHRTTFLPKVGSLYLLEFSRSNPLETRFLTCEPKEQDSFDPCLQEVFR
jgi:hypothetical protein